MTGHLGERRNRAVALVTDDFRLYHELAPFLESHGVRVVGIKPGEAVPASVKVLLGGPADDPRTVPLRMHKEATLLAVFAALDARPTARGGYQRVVFGVDPGQVIGLAALADGAWLHVAEVRSGPDAVARLAAWATGLAAKQWEVHVGDGDPQVGRGLLPAIKKALPQARVLLVSEEATSPHRPVTASRHTDAAVLIALREPRMD
ncbi:MAG: hypothetical protein AABY18_04890 [Candidatus Thermoplasmatota archaeon]